MTPQRGGPFRNYPWPLNYGRNLLRFLRLSRIKSRRFVHAAGPRFVNGDSISLARNADIRAPHFVELGHHISIGKNFTCEVDVRIGNNVLISSNVSLIGRDHPFEDPTTTVYDAPRTDNSLVEIGSDVLIGFGSIIIANTKIGDGCIVGAGSVVVDDLPPYMVCVGVPARPIRQRYTRASSTEVPG